MCPGFSRTCPSADRPYSRNALGRWRVRFRRPAKSKTERAVSFLRPSKLVTQCKLNDSRSARRCNRSKGRCAAYIRSRRVQMNIIEQVEEVGPDRGFVIFAKRPLHRPVEVKEPGTAQQITRRTTKSSGSIKGEGSCVEVLSNQRRPRPVGVQN